jgi:hypothetical protein
MAKEYEMDKKTLDGVQNVTIGKLALDIADLKAKVEDLKKSLEAKDAVIDSHTQVIIDLLARIDKLENK